MQYYEFTKHITPLPAGEGLGVGLCVLSTSYKAYYSPPYGGGAGGGALCFIYKLQSILLPSLRGRGQGVGLYGGCDGLFVLFT